MWYAYVLNSQKNGKNYIGITGDLKRRLTEHNTRSGGQYTSRNGPFKLIFYEAFLNKKDAGVQEKFYKTGYGREVLKEKLQNYFESLR